MSVNILFAITQQFFKSPIPPVSQSHYNVTKGHRCLISRPTITLTYPTIIANGIQNCFVLDEDLCQRKTRGHKA